MSPLGPTARKVLGLPDEGDWEKKKERKKARRAGGRATQGAAQIPVPANGPNPWESAARQLQAQRATSTTTPAAEAESGPESSAPWVTVPERSGSAFARKLGRGAVWVVVGLAAITGVRSWVDPNETEAPPPAPAKSAPAYPEDQAQLVAGRFARAYLAWDESKPKTRAAALGALLPDGADTAMGWDGRGEQDVLGVQPGPVTPSTHRQARVRVDVLIRPAAPEPAKKGKKAKDPPPEPARWVGLEIPVVETRGRVVVTGQPGMVGVPASGPALPDLPVRETDAKLTAATEKTIDKFFAAYAAGDTESVTAPGASVPPLPDNVTLAGVAAWSADEGEGDDRTGTARVSWNIGGAQIEQTYRIELTRVASTDAQRWQVANVHGGTA
ncbi:conjugal transfer protein [Streptomyces olivaceus]|uniref:conjugal transfer protein n=1 Tax=Streptomyces olivaceus TaxID=47716 RepID=UPI0036F9BA7E